MRGVALFETGAYEEAARNLKGAFDRGKDGFETCLYLGRVYDRLGDTRALPALNQLAEAEGIRYLDYIELRSAIEALGGEAPAREFYDDPEYEALFSTRSE